jgi:hypothetical protein
MVKHKHDNGREARARAALGHAGSVDRSRKGAACDHPAYLMGRERTYEGMRLAGVPEG